MTNMQEIRMLELKVLHVKELCHGKDFSGQW